MTFPSSVPTDSPNQETFMEYTEMCKGLLLYINSCIILTRVHVNRQLQKALFNFCASNTAGSIDRLVLCFCAHIGPFIMVKSSEEVGRAGCHSFLTTYLIQIFCKMNSTTTAIVVEYD